jgi:hypothetical protein
MVAPRKTTKIFCTVVRIPDVNSRTLSSTDRFSTRPSDLLPWADPYIARLVHRLQDEVRVERRVESVVNSELDPPSPATESDWDWQDESRWTLYDDVSPDFSE